MFEKGDFVFYENKGVCVIDEIAHMDMPGADKKRLYYALVPTGSKGSRIYSPTDNMKLLMRKIMTAEGAEKLLDEIPEVEEIHCANEKLQEEAYKKALQTCEPCEWIKIVKTLHKKRHERAKDGKKITSTDGKYLLVAEDFLYGELAAALKIDRQEAKERVNHKLRARALQAQE